MSINAKSVNFVLTRSIETHQNRPPVFHNILPWVPIYFRLR